jgi:hypothetical protein
MLVNREEWTTNLSRRNERGRPSEGRRWNNHTSWRIRVGSTTMTTTRSQTVVFSMRVYTTSWSSCVPAVLGAASAPPSQPLLLVFSGRVGPILTTIVLAAFSKGRSVLKRLPEPTICHLGRIEVARRSQLGNTDDGEKTAA